MQTTQRNRKTLGRPPLKQIEIVDAIRSMIVSGDLTPLHRLPTRRELGDRFSASPITVQNAIDQLLQDGFIQSQGKQGTFVAPHPPHLTCYALVFPHAPGDKRWSRFATALNDAARHINEFRRVNSGSDLKINSYYGIDGHDENENAHHLLRDMQAHRLAGLMFATAPDASLANSPILELPGIARVAIDIPDNSSVSRCIVALDNLSFIDKALDALAAAGRKKIATIRAFDMPDPFEDHLAAGLARRGMVSPPYWQLTIFQDTLEITSAKNITHLLMRPGQTDRPDGLFIIDDNLVPYVTAGLIEAGVKVGQDVEVIAHCNFPWPFPSVVPIRRLGYDARQVLGACVNSIEMQVRGEPPPPVTFVAPIFESEVQSV